MVCLGVATADLKSIKFFLALRVQIFSGIWKGKVESQRVARVGPLTSFTGCDAKCKCEDPCLKIIKNVKMATIKYYKCEVLLSMRPCAIAQITPHEAGPGWKNW